MNETEQPVSWVRIAIEVNAAVIPEKYLPEYKRQFFLTSDEWKAPNRKDALEQLHLKAVEYFDSIANPAYVNHVRMDWIYY